MFYISKKEKTLFLFIVIISYLMWLSYSPKLGAHGEHESDVLEDEPISSELPYMTEEGKLHGITWADDIHPIFVRNRCGECHTRTTEVYVQDLSEFALGIINPDDPYDPSYSYHELVYAEGPPQIQNGETLRDGQCCWPRKYSHEQQRRIWIGHADRSVIMRKLEGNYYDWNNPPRFLEEGLNLLWGVPMPMFHIKEGMQEYGYEVRSILSGILFRISLFFNRNRDKLYELPPRISVKDRALLRYWINNTEQVTIEGSAIEVYAVNGKGQPVPNLIISLIGNFNSPEDAKVKDIIEIETDAQGKASLFFPKRSVITSFWFVSEKSEGKIPEYKSLKIIHGKINKVKIVL
jgi:hypothetical protein